MTKDPLYERLRELSWRRPLTPAEEQELRAWLAAHPEAQAEWETEADLNRALERLPSAPVPSNFTSRVLQAVERESRRTEATPRWKAWLRLRWLPRLALVSMALTAGLIGYHHWVDVSRVETGRSVSLVAETVAIPSPEVLAHFDEIHAMTQPAIADEDLLKLPLQ